MTTDAKIGLLLGLVFIFLIAFIINGLPSFSEGKNNNELTTNIVSLQNNPPGLAAKERKANRELINRIEPIKKQSTLEAPTSSTANEDVRFTAPLPSSTSVVKETDEVKPVAPTQPLPVAQKDAIRKTESNKTERAKTYTVKEGDMLAVIAKKFYGPEDGNKRINITRIFEANRKVLKSPDEIYVGQKLIIPPLSASAPDKNKIESVFSTTMFKKVKSIGNRHLSADDNKTRQNERYVVQEGDSLWRIAAEQLGDGNRYSEIAKLNASILEDDDRLVVGMRLRMPIQ